MPETSPLPLRRWFWLQALVLLTAAVLALPALARPDDRGDRDDRDPPTRVARVAEIQGEAWWFDPDSRDWQPVVRNQTLAEGDRLRVGDSGRIGLRVGVHGFWLDARGELELRRLDEDRIDLDLEQGSLALRLATREAAYETRVRTQDGRFAFERAGAYRIDQLPRASRAAVYEGKLRFERRGDDVPPVYVDEGEQAELWWDGGPRAERGRLRSRDAFGGFLTAQLGFGDRGYASWEGRPAYRYVSPELTGADELDAYGRWERHDDYGPLWVPLRVAVDWAPYRYGRWTWTRHWGWTWVDDNPWGYATSHYGRWVYVSNRWCWTPGVRIVARPVFAPALVAWVGSGNVSIGIQIGGRVAPPVAWVPLSPWETYRPWYRHSPRYVARFEADPITVRRPAPSAGPSWTQVPGAVSTLQAGAGAQARPMPLRDEAVLRQMQPLPQAPSREVAAQVGLPVRAGFARPALQGAAARGDDDSPRMRAGGSAGAGGQGGFALPSRDAQAESRRETPVERRDVQPDARREMPWRRERSEAQEAREPREDARPDVRQEWRRAPGFEAGDRRSREDSMPMRAPQVQAPTPAPQMRMAEPPRRVEMPMRQEARPEPRPEPRQERSEPRRGRGDEDDKGPRRPER